MENIWNITSNDHTNHTHIYVSVLFGVFARYWICFHDFRVKILKQKDSVNVRFKKFTDQVYKCQCINIHFIL